MYDKTKTFDKAESKLTKTVEQVRIDKFWGEQFKDLVEIVYIVMKDGQAFPIGSQDGARINLNIGRLDEQLRKIKGKNYSVKEIDTVIHNHFRSPRFSSSDKKQYMRLKKFGFIGKFLMYNHMREQVYEYKQEKKVKSRKDNDK